jgi:hypothetical protein
MTGDHHGQSIERATLLVRVVDAILGTHTFEPGKTVRFPKAPARYACYGPAAPPAATGEALPFTPMRRC